MANEKKFYTVHYKSSFGRRGRAIVLSDGEEEAMKLFNDPDDPIGPKNEILRVTKPRKIPAGWRVTVEDGETLQHLSITKDIPIGRKPAGEEYMGTVRGKRVPFFLEDIVSASKPLKEHIM